MKQSDLSLLKLILYWLQIQTKDGVIQYRFNIILILSIYFMQSRETIWSKYEDQKLTELVLKENIKRELDWESIANQIKTKAPEQCEHRFQQRNRWKAEQISLLFALHKKLPKMWKMISGQLEKQKSNIGEDDKLAMRSDLDVKNKFYNFFRKGLRKIGKLIGGRYQTNFTEQVKQIKPNHISNVLFQYTDKYQNDFIYKAVLECALDSENKDNESSQRKQYSSEYIASLKKIYLMFLNRAVDCNKSQSISWSGSNISQQNKGRKQKKQKKIDTKMKKNKIRTIAQQKKLEQNIEYSSQEHSERRITRFRAKKKQQQTKKNEKSKQRGEPKILQKQRQRTKRAMNQNSSILRNYNLQSNQQSGSVKFKKVKIFNNIDLKRSHQFSKKKSSGEKQVIASCLKQKQKKQQQQQKPIQDSNRSKTICLGTISTGSGCFYQKQKKQQQQKPIQGSNRSITRSMAALIQDSSKFDNYKLPKVVELSQNEGMEIKAQVFTSGNGRSLKIYP